MIVQAHTKQQTVMTTTLMIDRPQNYALLEQRFRLVRYVLPDALRYRKNPTDFGRVHSGSLWTRVKLNCREEWRVLVQAP